MKILLAFLLLHGLVLSSTSSASSSSEEDGESSEKGGSEKDSEEHPKAHHPHWGYEDQVAWSTDFEHCSGKSQSPINIEPRKAIYDPKLPRITLEGYDLSTTDGPPMILQNNGHTLQLSLPKTMRIVTGFDRPYVAAQLHFHWGTVEVPGSEHTIDNIHFPAEIHVVHYNSKYADLSEAASKPDGLAVLGAFIGVGLFENEDYEKILSALINVSHEETTTEIPGFNVRPLLPHNLERFYRYNGSLTTPPCFQTVNWTMFNDTITVSRRQLAALEDTLKVKTQPLNKNFRPPQLLHGRRVLASFHEPIIRGRTGDFNMETGVAGNMGDWESGRPTVSGPQPAPSNAIIGNLSLGDIAAIALGALFVITLLAFIVQRRKYFSVKKDSRQNVIYKPATKEDV